MTASYPASVKTFTVHHDVTDTIYAADPNTIQDEVAAIETTLGSTATGNNPLVSATVTSASTWSPASSTYLSVGDRLTNIEKGVAGDSHGGLYVRTSPSTTYPNAVTPASTTVTGLTITAASGQSANLQEWRNSSGTLVAFVDSNGNINGVSSDASNAGVQEIFMLMGC
jgi:hypothetical protein